MLKATLLVAITIAAAVIGGCKSSSRADFSEGAFSIRPGMTKNQVMKIMGGRPSNDEFAGGIDEWHYCVNGVGITPNVAIWFADDKVIAKKRYKSMSCEIKTGNYREPDEVREYRIKFQ